MELSFFEFVKGHIFWNSFFVQLKGFKMLTITLKNEISPDFVKAIKAMLKTQPKELYTIKQKSIPALDKAIKEIKSGKSTKYTSIEQLKADLV